MYYSAAMKTIAVSQSESKTLVIPLDEILTPGDKNIMVLSEREYVQMKCDLNRWKSLHERAKKS